MKKVKLLFSKIIQYFKKQKVKEPVKKDLKISTENAEFCETDQSKEKPKKEPYTLTPMPFIVKIENATEKEAENVCLFFANNQLDSTYTSKGSLVKNGLIITSGIPNVTYNHIVKSTITKKIEVGLTYIVSENQRQVIEKFTIKGQSVNGMSFEKVVTPTKDPYQQQTNIVAVKEDYFIDSDTAIIIHKIHPKTTVQIYFYPQFKLN